MLFKKKSGCFGAVKIPSFASDKITTIAQYNHHHTMQKISLRLIVFIGLSFISLTTLIAQPCVKIESILVAACTSVLNTEGSNEMMRFRIGDTDVNTDYMNIVWGSGQYGYAGVIQNANTANKVAQLNATIESCGYLKEPVNGVLPANSQVLIVCGTNTSTTANSFAQLSDTLWIVFQNSSNTGGHFLNYVASGVLAQTTTISFSNITGCSSTATYYRNQLLMTNGTPGNEPGATVNFDENMNPVYINNGCIASIEQMSAAWNAPQSMCETADPINLNTLVTGTPGGFWTGNGVTGNTFNPAGLSGAINITYNVVNVACNDTLTNTHAVTINPEPNAGFTLPATICNYNTPINLNNTITGTAGGTFSGTGISSGTFSPNNLSGSYQITYTVGTGLCQRASTQTIEVISLPVPQLSPSSGQYCAEDELENIQVLNAAQSTVLWYNDEALTNQINEGENYLPTQTESAVFYVTLNQAGCVSSTAVYTLVILSSEAIAAFTLPATICNYNTPINLNNTITGTAGGTFSGTGISSGTFSPNNLSGSYQITYTVGTGLCQSTATQTIEVISLPVPQLSANSGDYCTEDEPETIEVLNAGTSTALWYDDAALTNEINAGESYIPTETENTQFYVTLNQAGCVSATAVYILAFHPIETIVEADVLTGTIPFNLAAVNASTNAQSCQWYLNGAPIDTIQGLVFAMTIEQPGTYILKLVCENDHGCKDSTETTFVVFYDKIELIIPNVFTPNGDNKNDEFSFTVSGIKTMTGKIYNRWGELVYEWEGLQDFWDGKVNGKEAAEGVYYYIVETVDVLGQSVDNKGAVTLTR